MENILALIQDLAVPKTIPAGEHLFHEGDELRGFYWIQSGQAQLYGVSINGERVLINNYEKGEFLAYPQTIRDNISPYHAEVLTDSTVFFFPTEKALPRIYESAELSRFFMGLMAEDIRNMGSRLNVLQLTTVKERLLFYLTERCPKQGACNVRLPYKKKELAAVLGTAPETLSRTFAELKKDECIEVNRREIRVLGCQRNKCGFEYKVPKS